MILVIEVPILGWESDIARIRFEVEGWVLGMPLVPLHATPSALCTSASSSDISKPTNSLLLQITSWHPIPKMHQPHMPKYIPIRVRRGGHFSSHFRPTYSSLANSSVRFFTTTGSGQESDEVGMPSWQYLRRVCLSLLGFLRRGLLPTGLLTPSFIIKNLARMLRHGAIHVGEKFEEVCFLFGKNLSCMSPLQFVR